MKDLVSTKEFTYSCIAATSGVSCKQLLAETLQQLKAGNEDLYHLFLALHEVRRMCEGISHTSCTIDRREIPEKVGKRATASY